MHTLMGRKKSHVESRSRQSYGAVTVDSLLEKDASECAVRAHLRAIPAHHFAMSFHRPLVPCRVNHVGAISLSRSFDVSFLALIQ